MVVNSHSSVTKVMTKQLGELLHMDTVGLAQACSFWGQWYVLVIVDDFSSYSWVFFIVTPRFKENPNASQMCARMTQCIENNVISLLLNTISIQND
jgi:hypothetical protein